MGTEFKSYSDLLRLYHALSAKCSQLYMDAVGRMQSIVWTLCHLGLREAARDEFWNRR